MRGEQQRPVAQQHQRGFAFLALAVLLVVGAGIFMAAEFGRNTRPKIDAQARNAKVLAQAKEALLAWAANEATTSDFQFSTTSDNSLGRLPCPDLDNDGNAEIACAQLSQRIGRLPFLTLNLPDLRDSAGERLWYAISDNMRKTSVASRLPYSRANLAFSAVTGGVVLAPGTANNGVAAVVLAPGYPLTRSDGVEQNRSCGVGCDAVGKCTALPPTNVSTCAPRNYLDRLAIGSTVSDNATMAGKDPALPDVPSLLPGVTTYLASSFFSVGLTTTSESRINDVALTISENELFQTIGRKIASEIIDCYVKYAAANGNRYPWPARVTSASLRYAENAPAHFGRVPGPDNAFVVGGASPIFPVTSTFGMSDQWPATCKNNYQTTPAPAYAARGWLVQWQPYVWVAVAPRHLPNRPTPGSNRCSLIPDSTGVDCLRVIPACDTDAAGNCVATTTSPALFNKELVVVVSGPSLSFQSQPTDFSAASIAAWNLASNFLEGRNRIAGTMTFDIGNPTPSFNDVVVSYPP